MEKEKEADKHLVKDKCYHFSGQKKVIAKVGDDGQYRKQDDKYLYGYSVPINQEMMLFCQLS